MGIGFFFHSTSLTRVQTRTFFVKIILQRLPKQVRLGYDVVSENCLERLHLKYLQKCNACLSLCRTVSVPDGGQSPHTSNFLRRKFLPQCIAAEIPAAFQKISRKQTKTPQPKQKRRNTVCFPGISAAFPPISAANQGVEKTENKFCRNSKKKRRRSGRNAANPKRRLF